MKSRARTVVKSASLVFAVSVALGLCGTAAGQSSASFKAQESELNAGGSPRDGSQPSSASFRISHDAIAGSPGLATLSSASYRAEGGFVVRYSPPGEVHTVRFEDATTLTWDHEPSSGEYNLYRGALGALPFDPGACLQSGLAGPGYAEADVPLPGAGWSYLVTATNRLRQEGTKGQSSDGTPRPNPASCP
ncbi:MAG: hypothetical protein KBD01_08395 [Acidobacteria bacterium]|nr:hypothetical protein [Acidobacteriota bacterium]